MMRLMSKLILVLIGVVVGAGFGVSFEKYKYFPYKELKSVYKKTIGREEKYGPWSIGVYEGQSPFDLSPSATANNPVLTGASVSNIDAEFVADPFIIKHHDLIYMFFEVLNRKSDNGDIGYAQSTDGINWEYKNIIIDESFHMSYPYVFKWEGEFYLIPESNEDLSVRLYKAVSFPDKWTYVGKLLSGYHYVDPSIVRVDERWWLFVGLKGNDTLNLFYADDLTGEWKPHAQNPIVKYDANIARPGGRILKYKGNIYRFAQDDDPIYGLAVNAFKVLKLDPDEYQDEALSANPILKGTGGKGWSAVGIHNIDVQRVGEKWLAIVDGKSR